MENEVVTLLYSESLASSKSKDFSYHWTFSHVFEEEVEEKKMFGGFSFGGSMHIPVTEFGKEVKSWAVAAIYR